MRKIIILGACSGIAQAVQRKLAAEGKELLLVARSKERLEVLRQDLLLRGASTVLTYVLDLADIGRHSCLIQFSQEAFSDYDSVLLAYGSMLDQSQCERDVESTVRQLHTDFVSAAAILTLFAEYFESRGSGCIAAITSVAGDRIRPANYTYGAAKGALSLFLEGLGARLSNSGIRVLTIKPGPVKTSMTAHLNKSRLFSEPKIVAADICRALESHAEGVLYTPGYWRYVMRFVRIVPAPIFKWLASRQAATENS